MRKLLFLAVCMIGLALNGNPRAVEKQELRSLNVLELSTLQTKTIELNNYLVLTKEERVLYNEKVRRSIELKQLKKSEFTFENFCKYLDVIEINHKDIIVRKAIIESGWFKSSLTVKHNNLFGMCTPTTRKTKALGTAFGKTVSYTDKSGRDGARVINYKYAKFKHWTDSVDDLMMWQNYWESKGYNTRDYYKFLNDLGYAYESNYIKVLKSVNVSKHYPEYVC